MSIAQLVLNGALCWAFCVSTSDRHSLWVSCQHCVGREGQVQVDSLVGEVVWSDYRPRDGVDICLIRTGRRADHVAFSVDRSRGRGVLWVDYPARPGKSGLPLVGKDARIAHGVLCWRHGLNSSGFTSLAHLPEDLGVFLPAGKSSTALQGRVAPPLDPLGTSVEPQRSFFSIPFWLPESSTALQGRGAPPVPPARICDPSTGICVPVGEQERTLETFPAGLDRAVQNRSGCR